MKRRVLPFGAAVLIAAVAFAVPASAQKTKIYRVAFIAGASPLSAIKTPDPINPTARAFVYGLRDLGYVEGRNLVLDFYTLEGRNERIPEVLANIVRSKADVILTGTQFVVERHLKETASIPVVTLATYNLVQPGVVQSLARPGGTVTGVIVDVDVGVEAKRLELLREVVPNANRVAYLGPPANWESPAGKSVVDAARRLGITLFHASYIGLDIQPGAAIIEREAPDAVYVPQGTTSYGNRQRIGQFVSAKHLPCIAGFKEFVEHGCLMSYGVDTNDLMRRAAGYVAKILEGAKPGELPILQPTKFELVINLKEAKALGVKIPQSVLLRADRVIE